MTPPYGGGVFIADTSAWNHADHAQARTDWAAAIRASQIVLSPIVTLELLQSARSGEEYDELHEELGLFRDVALSRGIAAGAVWALRELAHRGQLLHRLPIQDALIAASAQDRGYGVLHYDGDYDRLASVMAFESRWILPRGAI